MKPRSPRERRADDAVRFRDAPQTCATEPSASEHIPDRPDLIGCDAAKGAFLRWSAKAPRYQEAPPRRSRAIESEHQWLSARPLVARNSEAIREAPACRPELFRSKRVTAILGRFATMRSLVRTYGYGPAPFRIAFRKPLDCSLIPFPFLDDVAKNHRLTTSGQRIREKLSYPLFPFHPQVYCIFNLIPIWVDQPKRDCIISVKMVVL